MATKVSKGAITCECCGEVLRPYGTGMFGDGKISDELIENMRKIYEYVSVSVDQKHASGWDIVCVPCLEGGCKECFGIGKKKK